MNWNDLISRLTRSLWLSPENASRNPYRVIVEWTVREFYDSPETAVPLVCMSAKIDKRSNLAV